MSLHQFFVIEAVDGAEFTSRRYKRWLASTRKSKPSTWSYLTMRKAFSSYGLRSSHEYIFYTDDLVVRPYHDITEERIWQIQITAHMFNGMHTMHITSLRDGATGLSTKETKRTLDAIVGETLEASAHLEAHRGRPFLKRFLPTATS